MKRIIYIIVWTMLVSKFSFSQNGNNKSNTNRNNSNKDLEHKSSANKNPILTDEQIKNQKLKNNSYHLDKTADRKDDLKLYNNTSKSKKE